MKQTLESFFRFNSAPLDKLIVVEDGADIPGEVRDQFAGFPIEWISTGKRVRQIAAIDYAYSRVKTPYIFHLEDDWLFYRSGFMDAPSSFSSPIPSACRSGFVLWTTRSGTR